MDAFSVSIANGLRTPDMKSSTKVKIAGTFAGFQFLMPMLGWLFVHYLLETFEQFKNYIPWIALALLLYIGGKMIFEAFWGGEEDDLKDTDFSPDENKTDNNSSSKKVSNRDLIIQGIATSIDALSVGFTIADYKCVMAFLCSIIIAVVTYIICQLGLMIGIRVGMKLAKKASVLGGLILIFIGIEIFVKGVLL